MVTLRLPRLGGSGGAILAAVALLFSIFFGVGVTSLFAKKVDSIDKYVTSPVRVALTDQGALLLTDYLSQFVLVIDPLTLSVRSKVKIMGSPTGVDGHGQRFFVGNESTGNVEVYSMDGTLLETWGNGSIGLPNDIAIDHATGRLFVVDAKAHHVRMFDAEGQDLGIIPAAGATQQLINPTALTLVQNAGLVYVSDQGPAANSFAFRNRNAYVHIYRYDGSYVDTLSGEFSRPQGLTVNKDGYLYLADGMRGQILVFDLLSKGLIKTIGASGDGPGQLSLPLDVEINADTGDLLVTNNRAGRLEIFPGGGIAP